MKFYIFLLAAFIISCSDSNNKQAIQNDALKKENDSLKHIEKPLADTVLNKTDSNLVVVAPLQKEGVHPITLQWISWDKQGKASVKPLTYGWYSISGSQSNAENDYLKIDGKIKRISEKELEFDGTIEIKVSYNNGGEPCIKKGKQHFFAKGSRKYFRMQNMTNCQGGNLVDYVDIYPGTSSL
ncbi:MAG: hypothetical protein EOP53_12440 [Sphingobacteriales bacterium]|nr:MAG: hypothetical protein EOP53_12440 [Sphingobacteriales bacterium]